MGQGRFQRRPVSGVGGAVPRATRLADAREVSRRSVVSRSGFTLVEVGLVILILSIAAAMVIPQFRDRSHAELISQARRLAVRIRFLRQQAILNGRTYRLFYDLSRHRYWAVQAEEGNPDPAAGAQPPAPGDIDPAIREVNLPEQVGFPDVVFPLTVGKLSEGIGFTNFYPDGYVDLTIVHLATEEEAYTLRVEPFTGVVYVTAGYQDFDFST